MFDKLFQEVIKGVLGGILSGPDLVESPFAGLVYCGNCNAPMFLSKAVKKNGREYLYYVCQKDDRRRKQAVGVRCHCTVSVAPFQR